jgi:hypothetical protein
MTIEYKDSKRIVANEADVAVVSNRGTVDTSSSVGNTIITFTGNGTFTPTSSFNVQYLVVAGGGGGGAGGAAGGGAGGFKTNTGFGVTSQNYNITVGAGGAGGGISTNENGTKGSDSIFSTITSEGGGYGSGDTSAGAGGDGGSGGGGGKDGGNGNNKGLGTVGQGYNGGNGATTGGYQGSGGGGGSSAVGSDGNANAGGNGGSGTANPISGSSAGVSGYLAGGGGGSGSGGNGSGGSGGGGAGTWTGNVTGVAGTVNTGSGGGGGGEITINNGGGAGGSGIVIIKFATSGNTYSTSAGGKPTDIQDNSILVEKDTARRYWFDFTSDVTHSSLTNISASGNLLYSARRYGCKLTSGNTAIGQSVTSLAFNIQDSSYPSGESFYYKVYRSDDGSGDANTSWTQVATTGAISESELPASYAWLEKSFTTPVTLALNDVVCIEAANVGSSSAYISLSYNSSTSDISTANVKGAFRNSGVSDQFSTTTSGTEATVFKIIGTTATWINNTWDVQDDFSSYTTQTQADTAWIPASTSQARVNITDNDLDYSFTHSTTNGAIYNDVLGRTVSDTAFVCRYTIELATNTAGGGSYMSVGMASLPAMAGATTGNFLGNKTNRHPSVCSADKQHSAFDVYNNAINNLDPAVHQSFCTPAMNVVFPYELTRLTSTTYQHVRFTDDTTAYDTAISTLSDTCDSSLKDLRYMTITNNSWGTNGVVSGVFGNFKFIDGATTAP